MLTYAIKLNSEGQYTGVFACVTAGIDVGKYVEGALGWPANSYRIVSKDEFKVLNAPSLEQVKVEKLALLNEAFVKAEASGHTTSALGFEIDATARANRDMEGLITAMTASSTAKTMFCDYNNEMHEVTIDDIKHMRVEVIAYGQALYARKWTIREEVNACASKENLEAYTLHVYESGDELGASWKPLEPRPE